MNNLDNYYNEYEDDYSQEPQFNHNFINKINKKITCYYDIEGPILFYDNYSMEPLICIK